MKTQNREKDQEERERPADVVFPSIFMVKLTRLLQHNFRSLLFGVLSVCAHGVQFQEQL